MKNPRPARRSRSSPAGRAASTAVPALLAAALRAQSAGVFIAGPSSKGGTEIVFVNDSFCAMTGHRARKLLGRSPDFVHAEKSDLERIESWAQGALAGPSLLGEGYLLRAKSSPIYTAWSFDPICDEDGHVTHFVATYRDMTEKRRLQEALVHSQRLDAVGRLAGGVAHDFNNLISIINGYCQILAGQVADRPNALREVEEIHQAGQKAAALTRQLLAFGRRQPMNPRVINLNHLVRENAQILERLLGDAGQLEFQLTPNIGQTRADPTQLQQVLINLVLNARDALHDKGRVVIATERREIGLGLNRRVTDMPPGHYVALTVSDNGRGMDAVTQSHLFEPFFTTKEEGKGTGLGLALVYGVVQQSGGFISVRSTLLVGSTFEVLLPEVLEPAEHSPSLSLPALPTTRGHETVLLLESDEIVGKMVAGILTSDGYQVITASNAGKALRQSRRPERPVQLLIASIDRPGSEPERLAQALNEANPGLRVLNTSLSETAVLPWVSPEHQVALPKPFALSELLKAARKLLDA